MSTEVKEEAKNGAAATATPPQDLPPASGAPVVEAKAEPPVVAADVLPPPVVPEVIEVKLPDGSNLVGTRVEEFKSIFANPKLTAGQRAQAVIDVNTKWVLEDRKVATDNRTKAIADYRKLGEDALKADPLFGKDYEGNRQIAKRPLERYKDGKALSEKFAALGLDNDPDVVRFLHWAGQSMAEDSTRQPAPVPPGIDDRMAELRKMFDHPTSEPTFKPSPS